MVFRAFTAAILAAFTLSAQEFRTIDGSNNNLVAPSTGTMGATLSRLTPARYADGFGTVDATLPNPRDISNAIFSQDFSLPDQRGLSEWVWVWGQFIDHDLDHTLTSGAAGVLQIPIPGGDPVFGHLPPGSAINMTRSALVAGTGTGGIPREHANNISAWLDGGMVYGGRAVDGPSGVNRADWLRDPLNPAKLRVTSHATFGDLLPTYQHGVSPVMANTHVPTMTSGVEGDLGYVAGDVRANENTSLLALHTIYVREHNRIVDVLAGASPGLNSNDLYEHARKIVGAQIQAITYNEFLPAMGVGLSTYAGYNPNVDGSVLTEFSTAAFRVAHSQINEFQLRLNEYGDVISEGNLSLASAFFNPSTLLEGGLEPLLRGLAAQVQEANDASMVDALRNQLFQAFIPGIGLVDGATDLAAIDIMRGRDMGIGTFNDVRLALGLDVAITFSDITSDASLAAALASLYTSVDDLDLWVGLLVEDHLPDASLGLTTERLYALQFEALRDGDRFWFQNDLDGINSDLMFVADWDGTGERSAIDWLNSLSLSDVLLLNSDLDTIQEDVFFASPVPEPSGLLLAGLAALSGLLRRKRRS